MECPEGGPGLYIGIHNISKQIIFDCLQFYFVTVCNSYIYFGREGFGVVTLALALVVTGSGQSLLLEMPRTKPRICQCKSNALRYYLSNPYILLSNSGTWYYLFI